jgi:hypothetical protein
LASSSEASIESASTSWVVLFNMACVCTCVRECVSACVRVRACVCVCVWFRHENMHAYLKRVQETCVELDVEGGLKLGQSENHTLEMRGKRAHQPPLEAWG